jgi:hypothetical protein
MGSHRLVTMGAPLRSPARRVATLAALLALLLQAFLVQTHIHSLAQRDPRAAIVQTAQTNAAGLAPDIIAPPSSNDECALCQALATAGTAILAAAPAPAPVVFALASSSRLPIRRGDVQAAHDWQSRAPPTSL